ncbi:uncharacterized protein BJX67DRAFT_367395 [Aspergillus lucknowensis]|uniref:Fungal lipase-type domain-containing protein n=1 Tax=Aspergillus lucknowensis TaxID=176173 RepID=A0ABR4L9L3_9EURO
MGVVVDNVTTGINASLSRMRTSTATMQNVTENITNHLYDANDLKSIEKLVFYASSAYDNSDGAEFRAQVKDLEGPTASRKLAINTPLALWKSNNHVHLGVRSRNTIVIVFRGTDFPLTIDNLRKAERWLGLLGNCCTDISYALTTICWDGTGLDPPLELKYVLVHEGFLHAFNNLREGLSTRIRQLMPPGTPLRIEICGHSLGGALATLCALWCRIKWPTSEILCVTLGSPRVGDEKFAEQFGRSKIRSYRLVMDHDPVPTLPNGYTEAVPFKISADKAFIFTRSGTRSTWKHVSRRIPLRELHEHIPNETNDDIIVGPRITFETALRCGLFAPYWLLKGPQLLWHIGAHSPKGYATKAQKILEEYEEIINGHTVNLALALEKEGELQQAESLHRQTLERRERTLGPSHLLTRASAIMLGCLMERQKDHEGAKRLHEQAFRNRDHDMNVNDLLLRISAMALGLLFEDNRQNLSTQPPDTLASVRDILQVSQSPIWYGSAEQPHRDVLEHRWRSLGPNHPDTLASIRSLGLVLQNLGRYQDSVKQFQQAEKGSRKTFNVQSLEALAYRKDLGLALQKLGKFTDAQRIHEQVLDGCKRALGSEHHETLAAKNDLAIILTKRGMRQKAAALHQEALAGYKNKVGRQHPFTCASAIRDVIEDKETLLGKDHPLIFACLILLLSVLERQQSPEAENLRQRVLMSRQQIKV